MTRKEQREQASVEYQMNKNPMALGGDVFADMIYRLNINPSFIAGAEWADESMIQKACEWLINWDAYRVCLEGHKEWFIEQFKKAMEE